MLTGRYPSRHGLLTLEQQLPAEIPTLAEIMAEHGYQTTAIINTHILSPRYGLHRGFETFHYVAERSDRMDPTTVTTEAIRWLKWHRQEPFLLFLHYYDVHNDYVSYPEYESEFVRQQNSKADGTGRQLHDHRLGKISLDEVDAEYLIDLYDAGIRQLDDSIARLLDYLDQKKLRDNTIVILTSDHGEEFYERGGYLHGVTHYQELIRIPLLVSGPGIPAGERTSELVSLVDVVPTILTLASIPSPAGLDGINLSPLWTESEPDMPTRLIFSEGDWDRANETQDIKRAARHPRFTMHVNTVTDEWKLFDLQNDPSESANVLDKEEAMARFMREKLEEFMSVEASSSTIDPLSEKDIEKLRSLGYL
jgi:arylsulfatase A-like enzyme